MKLTIGVMGSSGGILSTEAKELVIPLAYTVAKRAFRMRGDTLRTFLTIHIDAALVGALLALIHTGHKFDNPLGVLLTAMMLIVVLSGFVGRYLLRQTVRHLADKRRELAGFTPTLEATPPPTRATAATRPTTGTT